jgi:hypothetical protein
MLPNLNLSNNKNINKKKIVFDGFFDTFTHPERLLSQGRLCTDLWFWCLV